MKQLKYLVLIPLLASMLFYTSCTNEVDNTMQTIKENISNENLKTDGRYFRGGNNGLILFMGTSLSGKVVAYEDYTDKEKEIYDKLEEVNKHNRFSPKNSIVINEEGERVFFVKLKSSFSNRDNYSSGNGSFEITEKEEVPFSYIDKAPIIQGCEGKDQKELRDCFNNEIRKFVAKNFNGELAKNLGLSGKQKIYIKFKITKSGKVEVLGARAPKKELEEEARRVVTSLPTMIPGEYKGEVVNTMYMLPIAFDVQ